MSKLSFVFAGTLWSVFTVAIIWVVVIMWHEAHWSVALLLTGCALNERLESLDHFLKSILEPDE